MKKLQKFAERWARYVSTDRSALKDSIFGMALGLALLGVYLLRSPDYPIVLATAVFVMMLSIKRFERAGFIQLLNRSREQIETADSSPIHTGSRG